MTERFGGGPGTPVNLLPPPIPKQALERTLIGERRSPLLADGRVSGPPARSSLPAPPPVGAAPSSAPPSSGIYRIPETKTEIDRWKDVVRELELKVRLRDDLISELKRSLEELKKLATGAEARVASAEARMAATEARLASTDARAAAAEARAVAADERAAAAEERASIAEQRAASVPGAAPDDLKRIKGIGPSFERKLRTLGVNSYADVAGWTAADIERISEALAILPQRIARDGWIESARELLSAK